MTTSKSPLRGCSRKGTALSFLAAMATAACSSDPVEPSPDDLLQLQEVGDEVETLVMTRGAPTDIGMDALFEGPVITDDAGCLRWQDEEGPTVVWPFGFTGEVTPDGISILDEDGNDVGRVGDEFSLGGGIIPNLPEPLGFSQGDRDLAGELCPGDYLLVAPSGAG